MNRFVLRIFALVLTVLFILPIDPTVAGGPQSPSCGTYKVAKNETIAGQAFLSGTQAFAVSGFVFLIVVFATVTLGVRLRLHQLFGA